MPIVYLNNVRGFDHRTIYGPRAFFDLGLSGYQERLFRKIEPQLAEGQECVVASYVAGGREGVVFKAYTFSKCAERRGGDGALYRVFFGDERLGEQATMTKYEAAQTTRYKPFFDARGNFKRGLSAFVR